MNKAAVLLLLVVSLWPSFRAFSQAAVSLRGTVKDPSGAAVPGAAVELSGPGRAQRKTTDINGQYSFLSLMPGRYQVRVSAKGFGVAERRELEIKQPAVFDVQLQIQTQEQQVTVESPTSGGVKHRSYGQCRRAGARPEGTGRAFR